MTAVTVENVYVAAKPIIGAAPPLDRDFISLFGVTPKVVAAIWNITSFDHDVKLKHLLWALVFLKVYSAEKPLMCLCGVKNRHTYRKYVWKVLSSLKQKAQLHVRCVSH